MHDTIPSNRASVILKNRSVRGAPAGMILLLFMAWPARAALAQGKVDVRQINSLFAGIASDRDPGVAVLVLRNGRTIFECGYGAADLATMRPIDARTNFRLASLTKQFTAMAVMLLVRDGKLSYGTALTDIFPDFPEYGRGITVRNLLQHTSGLLDYESLMPGYDPGAPHDDIPQIQDEEVLELLKRQTTTKFPPGTRWDYSNSGYVLLGLIIARVSARPFDEFLQERIFRPLGMEGSVAYRKGKNDVANRAFGHSMRQGAWRRTDQSPTSATLGDGGVYSSLADLARWDQALREHALLGEEEMQAALTPVRVAEGSVVEPGGAHAEYGFGWFLNPYKGHPRMWHYGETIGFRTAIQRFTADGLTVIVLCNRSDLDASALALKAAELCLPGP